jgi:hypothetical protein
MPILKGLLEYYSAYENEDGLLQDLYSRRLKKYAILVDWPKNLRDGYDDPLQETTLSTASNAEKGVVNTMVQGFYSCCLQAAEHLAEVADSGEVHQLVNGRTKRLHAAVLSQLRNPKTGLFVDRNGSGHSALHANVTPLMAGMVPPEDRQTIVALIRQKRLSCGVYFSFFVLKALFDAGEHELAYDFITSRDLHSWNSMLAAGATTCMEAWAPDLKWNTSWCHPWSSAPIYMVAHEIMGLRPQTPGWKEIRFAPRPPAALTSATIRLTTPQGRVAASFEQTYSTITYRLDVPEHCTVTCCLEQGGQTKAMQGGRHTVSVKKRRQAGVI